MRPHGGQPYLFGVAAWAAAALFLLVLGCCMTMAIADGTLYLRAMMPYEEDVPAAAAEEPIEAEADTSSYTAEQHLLERLYQNDQDAVYEVVKNDQRWRVVRMRVTAYCPCSICCGKFADGVTACNHRIRPGDVFVAADKMYQFGTEMIIPGYNDNRSVQVLDRGRVIKGNRLDVFFHSHAVAKKWGTRTLDVLVREN